MGCIFQMKQKYLIQWNVVVLLFLISVAYAQKPADTYLQEDAQAHADHAREETQEFQERMSSTAYQRAVEDMKKSWIKSHI
jgi:hypothetical protein